MRPTPIPDDEVWEGATRRVIGPPNGDLFSDVQPVEVLTEVDGDGRQLIHVRVVLEEDDVRRIRLGEHVFWITTWSNHVHPFDVSMPTEAPVVELRCVNCGHDLVEGTTFSGGSSGVYFHRALPGGCSAPTPIVTVPQLPPTLETWAEEWLTWAATQPFANIETVLHRQKLEEEHGEYQEDPTLDEAIDVMASLLLAETATRLVNGAPAADLLAALASRAMERLEEWKTRGCHQNEVGTWSWDAYPADDQGQS